MGLHGCVPPGLNYVVCIVGGQWGFGDRKPPAALCSYYRWAAGEGGRHPHPRAFTSLQKGARASEMLLDSTLVASAGLLEHQARRLGLQPARPRSGNLVNLGHPGAFGRF